MVKRKVVEIKQEMWPIGSHVAITDFKNVGDKWCTTYEAPFRVVDHIEHRYYLLRNEHSGEERFVDPVITTIHSISGDWEEDRAQADAELTPESKQEEDMTLGRDLRYDHLLDIKPAEDFTMQELQDMGWSSCRAKAFICQNTNANEFYYRFNAPGESLALGPWTKEEHKLFMKRMSEGVRYSWGIFSKTIPGRVGYSCQQYYYKLIREGKLRHRTFAIVEDKSNSK